MKYSLIILVCLISMLCCKTDKSENVAIDSESALISTDIPEDFLGFYLKFHSDSLYQMEHIVFPLKEDQNGNPWLAKEWTIHKPFNDQGGSFTQTFVNMNGLVIEYIQDVKQIFKMERRFMKRDGAYNLIYYKIENILKESGEWEATSS